MNSILIRLLMSLLTIFTCSNGYDNICPHSSQWNLTSRSYRCVDQKTYICLFDLLESNRTNKTVFRGACGNKDVSKEGTKYILNPNLEQVPCDAIQYQPFTFTTNGSSQCALGKSLCKSSGQILASNGSFFGDASCRCDYTRGFDYIIPPNNPCSCKPAEEDCSCYIRKCDDDKVMIADYRCVTRVETILLEDIKCPIISRTIPPEETDAVDKKQFHSIPSSRTWSKLASVILIVIVIIFTVLVGFLFFSVPHVTCILLKSKLELSVHRKENEFMIFDGENIKIECNVKSYIPVRSVTWQKEIDGEIIEITPSMEKYEMDCGKRPSLTIDNFNSEDQGKYICIVRNAVGLQNELLSSCMTYMSRVDWLTGFVTVLQHIPAFHTEDITLHNYDIDSQSKPTVYNVFKGDDITMEPHIDDQHKLIAVKWFNENDKRTDLDLTSEQYSGGVPDCPSLTIKTTRLENAGKYVCLLIYDNGETQKALIKLKIILQVKIYKAILNHRGDETFIRPSVCDTIYNHLSENNIVVITGREGTGKSKICLELASFFYEKDYMVLEVDLKDNHKKYSNIIGALLIIDDHQYTQGSLNTFMKHFSTVLSKRNIKVILTCRNSDLEIVKSVLEIKELKDEAFIDINNCLTPKEKEKMINRYLEVYNIATSYSNENNFRDPKVLTDLSVQVQLDVDAIKIITNEEPWKGFPLCASLFCSERKFLHLGEKYFTYPPNYLVKELKELYKTARKASDCIDKINDYCVLVHIMNNNNHQLELNDPNLYCQLAELYQLLFQFKYISEKPGSNKVQKKSIEEALQKMNNKYLKFHEGVYEFIHPCLLKAMFLSSDSMISYLLEAGSLHDITEFIRSKVYTGLENELIIRIDEESYHTLCERLVSHAFENRDFMLHVAQYIYSYWRSSDNYLLNEMFRHIEFILFKSLEVDTGDPLSLDNKSLYENSIKLEGQVPFSTVILLVDELTFKGRDPWIYGPGSADFLILSALVSAAINRYATDKVQTFKILLDEFENRVHLESFVKLCSKPLDRYGNTFFHYLMGLNQKEASAILSVVTQMKYIFDTENVKKYTPLDIAAFLGKIDIFEVLNLKTSNCTNKLRKRLLRLARCGKDEYFNENIKNKQIDQSVIHKTKDDGASPAKLEHEDADDEKKEVVDENNQNIKTVKRKLIHRKKESNEKENHDKRHVLCFEDFMRNVVVNGEEDDYQSIIKLFSKKMINYGNVKNHTA